jgi:hypothetical protein
LTNTVQAAGKLIPVKGLGTFHRDLDFLEK